MENSVFSLAPPLVAICLCVWLRMAIPALFAGIYTGALLLGEFSWHAPLTAAFRAVDDFALNSLTDRDHAVNLMFTTFIGGLVEVLNRSPASHRLLGRLIARLKNRARAGVAVWVSGTLFFIDDYANALIVGNAFRKVADKFKMSREKLAYLVDTTSAPIASIALVSTWIGFEISLIVDAIEAEGLQGHTGYGLFLASIPYRFYPLLALGFCLAVAWSGRDFGPMLAAEENSLRAVEPPPPDSDAGSRTPPRTEPAPGLHWLVVVPLIVLVTGSIVFLAVHGYQNGAVVDGSDPWRSLISLLSEADAFLCLLWATLTAMAAAFIIHPLFLGEPLSAVFENWFEGCKGMFMICVILILAWSIGDVCKRLETGTYVAGLLGAGFDPHFLPLLTFLLAAAISFATGTSFGTMSILMPIAVPIVAQFAADRPDVLYGTIGSVLGGAIFGDHCSPLSDTTILSAGASGCGVIEHVNTQLPYALTVVAVSIGCLLLVPVEWIPAWILQLIGLTALILILRAVGRRPGGDVNAGSKTK